MAASLPPAVSDSPAASRGSNLESQSKPPMTPSPASAPSSQAKPEAAAASKTGPAPVPEAENSSEQPAQKPATNGRRAQDAKLKKKKKVKEKAECVGCYVDALDKKMLWGEARIIQCNLSTQKIKVHFVGWSKNYDLWTDPMSITAHGRYAPVTMKGPKVKSWGGDMHLFQDMLGTIEESTFTPVPTPKETTPQAKSSAAPVEKKRSHKKKVPGAEPKTARSTEKTFGEKTKPRRSAEKAATKRKVADAPVVEKVGSKRAATTKIENANGRKTNEQSRDKKRQKQEVTYKTVIKPKPTKSRATKKKRALSPDELPLFRELELEDGTVVDLSEQRDRARVERESMNTFLDKCAQIWKTQLGALSVQ